MSIHAFPLSSRLYAWQPSFWVYKWVRILVRIGRLESPYVSIRLLSSLKGFFTFKELEDMLGIPYQVIWRYISLKNTPEKPTARKIISKIEELRLIERAFDRILRTNAYGYVETWRLLTSFKFLDLMGYIISKFVGEEDVNIILAHPSAVSPLAIISSDWISSKAVSTLDYPGLTVDAFARGSYVSHDKGRIMDVFIPRSSINRGDKIILVKDVLNNLESIDAIMRIIDEVGSELWGIFSIVSVSDKWLDNIKKYGIGRISIFKILETA